MICDSLKKIKKEIGKDVQLIAVSKTKPVEAIQTAYDCEQRDFGENKVQEMLEKYEHLPKDIHWHMIGHLQRNKVKYIAPFVHLIHGVDNAKLLKEIDKQAQKNNRIIKVLLQIKIAKEETKFGMNKIDLEAILNEYQNKTYPNIKIVGFMGMATNTQNHEQVAQEFSNLHKLLLSYQKKFPELTILSMGMSGDYKIAIAQGSNMVRIGSAIFGARDYQNI